MDIFNMGAPTRDLSSVELVFHMAVNHLIWRRRCQVLHLEPPLHEDAYESFLKIELERAVNMASTKIYDIQLFFDEWLYLDLFELINGVYLEPSKIDVLCVKTSCCPTGNFFASTASWRQAIFLLPLSNQVRCP
jgi:hypothetical protein